MRRLTPGDVSAKLARIEQSARSRRWKKAARRRLLADLGAQKPQQGHKIELPNGEYVCTKRRFPTFSSAFLALLATSRSPAPNRQEQRVYPCESCKAWHLTSTEDRSDDRTEEDLKDQQEGHREGCGRRHREGCGNHTSAR